MSLNTIIQERGWHIFAMLLAFGLTFYFTGLEVVKKIEASQNIKEEEEDCLCLTFEEICDFCKTQCSELDNKDQCNQCQDSDECKLQNCKSKNCKEACEDKLSDECKVCHEFCDKELTGDDINQINNDKNDLDITLDISGDFINEKNTSITNVDDIKKKEFTWKFKWWNLLFSFAAAFIAYFIVDIISSSLTKEKTIPPTPILLTDEQISKLPGELDSSPNKRKTYPGIYISSNTPEYYPQQPTFYKNQNLDIYALPRIVSNKGELTTSSISPEYDI
jgi:hypothetical protein